MLARKRPVSQLICSVHSLINILIFTYLPFLSLFLYTFHSSLSNLCRTRSSLLVCSTWTPPNGLHPPHNKWLVFLHRRFLQYFRRTFCTNFGPKDWIFHKFRHISAKIKISELAKMIILVSIVYVISQLSVWGQGNSSGGYKISPKVSAKCCEYFVSFSSFVSTKFHQNRNTTCDTIYSRHKTVGPNSYLTYWWKSCDKNHTIFILHYILI